MSKSREPKLKIDDEKILIDFINKYIQTPTAENLKQVRDCLIDYQDHNPNIFKRISTRNIQELLMGGAYIQKKENAEKITLELLSITHEVLNPTSLKLVFPIISFNRMTNETRSTKIFELGCAIIDKAQFHRFILRRIFSANLIYITLGSIEFADKKLFIEAFLKKQIHFLDRLIITPNNFLTAIHKSLEYKLITQAEALLYLSQGFKTKITSEKTLLDAIENNIAERKKSKINDSRSAETHEKVIPPIKAAAIFKLITTAPKEDKVADDSSVKIPVSVVTTTDKKAEDDEKHYAKRQEISQPASMDPFLKHLHSVSAFSLFNRLKPTQKSSEGSFSLYSLDI